MIKEKEKKFSTLDPVAKAEAMAAWLVEKRGEQVRVMDVRGQSESFDVMVLASGRNVRHAKALADFVLDNSAKEKFEFLGIEGNKSAQWILLDMNDVIVHIFLEELREYFNLEGLWPQAVTTEFGSETDVTSQPEDDEDY